MSGASSNTELNAARRVYVHPVTQEKFPAVTTILKATAGAAGLVNWAARQAAEFAVDKRAAWLALDPDTADGRQAAIDLIAGAPDRYRDSRGDIGSAVHAVVEALVLDQPLPTMTDIVQQRMDHFLRWMEDYAIEFWMSEITVANRTIGYAGTLDGGITVGRCDDRRMLVDVKSGNLRFVEMGLQLKGYREGEEVWLPHGVVDAMPEVDGVAVLHLTDEGYDFLELKSDEETWDGFCAAATLYRYQLGGERKHKVGKIRRSDDPHFIEDFPSLAFCRKAFAAVGLLTLEQLVEFDDKDLLGIPKVGKGAVEAVHAAIIAAGVLAPPEQQPQQPVAV